MAEAKIGAAYKINPASEAALEHIVKPGDALRLVRIDTLTRAGDKPPHDVIYWMRAESQKHAIPMYEGEFINA